ncbi:hypothetical protein GLOTRDRAFT_110096 [Gloeophyllum trabeum ATCC 11539]|uniref:Uncharacterized protein n=1 Tax=Gloeophyllum trabeum (strain ATCC 11539 / FP-39264 / Madison 617) TaxID=670483 RepID=S7QGD6_GLOTA|nr:uncharacterized protein GLOTRDRAFT_110096 [Gloeophyllum trabeum ATCC 11539]EPQ58243.1 hypothetical protein GLOTRDRAFT_110096 [Gloeophyllum trabeum ATCC 11539]
MPRRPPPSALRLVPGPTPPRGQPKHVLPSLPNPTFQPPSMLRGPSPRPRTKADTMSSHTRNPEPAMGAVSHLGHRSHASLPALIIPGMAGMEPSPTPVTRSPSPTSSSGSKFVPGPWDHSRSIVVPLNVDTLLAAPKPAAVSPATGFGWMMI